MFDLTSAEDGDDSGTPVVLQCALPFLNLLHRPDVEVIMAMPMIKRRLQRMIGGDDHDDDEDDLKPGK